MKLLLILTDVNKLSVLIKFGVPHMKAWELTALVTELLYLKLIWSVSVLCLTPPQH